MRLIDADTAQPGLTIVAIEQSGGKGQRGKVWQDSPGECLLMSIVTAPKYAIDHQFLFNVSATVAIAEVLQQMNEGWDVRIKWPNDIIVNDKKAGGVLIENVIRGSNWSYSIIGIGINVNQRDMSTELPYATSLRRESGRAFDINELLHLLRRRILENLHNGPDAGLLNLYNQYLFRKGQLQKFSDESGVWEAQVMAADTSGQLVVMERNGEKSFYTHGTVKWQW